MKDTPWDHGLRVTAEADGLVGHAGAVAAGRAVTAGGLLAGVGVTADPGLGELGVEFADERINAATLRAAARRIPPPAPPLRDPPGAGAPAGSKNDIDQPLNQQFTRYRGAAVFLAVRFSQSRMPGQEARFARCYRDRHSPTLDLASAQQGPAAMRKTGQTRSQPSRLRGFLCEAADRRSAIEQIP